MINRQNMLKSNKEAGAKLQVLVGRSIENCHSEFINNPLTLQYFHKLKGTFLNPFTLARLCTHQKENISETVGNPIDVQAILNALIACPGYPVTSKAGNVLLWVFLNKSATDLTLKVDGLTDKQAS
jgi:hypothetical protein